MRMRLGVHDAKVRFFGFDVRHVLSCCVSAGWRFELAENDADKELCVMGDWLDAVRAVGDEWAGVMMHGQCSSRMRWFDAGAGGRC